jgi:hypothetical protein
MISPTVSAVFNLLFLVAGGVAAAAASLTTLFGAGTSASIVAYAGIAVAALGAINSYLHGVSAPVAGPLAK